MIATRDELLRALVDCAPDRGVAEEQDPDLGRLLRNFLVTPPFRNALQPDVYMAIGDRGAGKTELFRVLAQGGVETLGVPPSEVVVGFGRPPGVRDQPPDIEIDDVLGRADEQARRVFWLGMLARHLPEVRDGLTGRLGEVLRTPDARIGDWLPVVLSNLGALLGALDAYDDRMSAGNRRCLVIYDELDRSSSTYEGLFPPLRALLALWLDRCRQWRAIRPKIFLRQDLFVSELLAFPDGAKFFAAHKVDLAWSPGQLYDLLLKRLLNLERQGVTDWLRAHLGASLVVVEDSRLGAVPRTVPSAHEALMVALVGRYMGANPRKGASVTWVPNHLQDANGRLAPRSFLKLFRYAAEEAEKHPGPRDLPLAPADFAAAEVRVSEDRIQEVADEDPWIRQLKGLLQGQALPMDFESLFRRLDSFVQAGHERLPFGDAAGLGEYLVRRGILEGRPDGRVNMPDIYRHGLGLTRKGGVRRHRDGDG